MAMSGVTNEFTNKFHALQGVTIGERRKNLFNLLKFHRDAKIDVTKLKPESQLEEIFRIDVLIYFKNAAGIIEAFKNENPALLKKLIKIDWLWNFFDENVVAELFPQISFNAKLKIINKLSIYLKNTQKADTIFKVINEKYGMYLASKLLPCCSFSLISQYFTCMKYLQTRQFLFILKKHPNLTKRLSRNENRQFLDQKCIAKYILQHHLELFEKLYTATYGCSKLGWRATDKFVRSNKPDVINKAPYFYEFLHKKQVVKSIGTDFSRFYIKMFPENYDVFNTKISLCLDLLENPNVLNKFDVFAAAFKTAYGGDVLDNDVVDLRLLELMNDQQRSRIADRLDIPNIVWICLKKPAESLPALQKFIALASDTKTRGQLVGSLIETCRINKDNEALLEVCKYVYKNHRNDDVSVLISFLKVFEQSSLLTKLNEEHWFYLSKILKIVVNCTMWYYYTVCLHAYFYFLFTHKKLLKSNLRTYAQKTVDLSVFNRGFKLATEFEKHYLVLLGEVLPEIYKDKELKTQYVSYLCRLIQWNKKHPRNTLPLFDNKDASKYLLEEWQEEGYNHSCGAILVHILCSKTVANKSFWVENYFKKKVYCEIATMEWLIKYDPQIVCDHIELIINCILDMYYTQVHRFFLTMSRNYAHLNLPQRISKICTDVIASPDESDDRKKNALTSLSYVVAEPQEFIELLTPYYPVDKTEPDATVYIMQQNMSRALGNIIPPSSMLHSVLLFSKGDYTKFIRRSMYLIAFSVTEDKLGKFFANLNSLAVSVRKHAIYLAFRVLDRDSIYNIIKRNLLDKNLSMRKFLMRSVFNFFVKNPDEFVWNTLKDCIKNVDVDDKEAFDVLVQLQKVPSDYRAPYIEFIAAFLSFDDKVTSLMPDSLFATLNRNFFTNIIDSNKYGDDFIRKALINTTDTELQLAILEKVFMQRKTPTFLRECAECFITDQHSNVTLLLKCVELLNGLEPHDKYLDDFIYLQLCHIYAEYRLSQKSISKFAQALVLANNNFRTKYKPTMLYKFYRVVSPFVTNYFRGDDLFTLIENLIGGNSSEFSVILAITLLPRTLPAAPKLKLALDKITSVLQCSQHPTVNMSLSLYLNEVMPQQDVIEEQLKRESNTTSRYYSLFNPYYDSAYACALSKCN